MRDETLKSIASFSCNMARQTTPAIAGHYSEEDRDVSVISTAKDSVSFQRGFGESGRRIQIVEHECPKCEHPTMLREWRVNAEFRDDVAYYCNNPHCRYHHDGEFSYAFYHGPTDGPLVERYEE